MRQDLFIVCRYGHQAIWVLNIPGISSFSSHIIIIQALGSQTHALLGSRNWKFYFHIWMSSACLTVLVRASIAVIKHHNWKLGRKGLFHLIICSLASGVVGARAGAGAVEKFCLPTWIAWLLKSPSTAISGVALPNVIKVLPHDHQPRWRSTDFPRGQSYRGIFSSKIPSSKMTLGSF